MIKKKIMGQPIQTILQQSLKNIYDKKKKKGIVWWYVRETKESILGNLRWWI